MKRVRLDKRLTKLNIARTRSQAENLIKLGRIKVDGKRVIKPGIFVRLDSAIKHESDSDFVSRAGEKLASVADKLDLSFKDKVVLDVGSSTGGFTDYAIQQGAKKVVAVDVGTNQMAEKLRTNPKVELHEKTDIRDFSSNEPFDVVLIDLSFISITKVLKSIKSLSNSGTNIVAMVKPQFEAGDKSKHKGVIKNDTIRRQILSRVEENIKSDFFIEGKADSEVAGAKGNRERFYLLSKLT